MFVTIARVPPATLARGEGLTAHAKSAEYRMKQRKN
jgi:histidinol dehydrogenase